MRLARYLAATLPLLSATVAGSAQAQAKNEPIEYRFSDDQMIGSTLSENLAILNVRPHPLRVTLIRPRASFVAELLSSCENM